MNIICLHGTSSVQMENEACWVRCSLRIKITVTVTSHFVFWGRVVLHGDGTCTLGFQVGVQLMIGQRWTMELEIMRAMMLPPGGQMRR